MAQDFQKGCTYEKNDDKKSDCKAAFYSSTQRGYALCRCRMQQYQSNQ